MPQSLAQVYVHLVFSTKSRQPFLNSLELRNKLHAYMSGICKNMQSPALDIGGTEDHVHILCRLGRETKIADLVRNLKSDSTKWIKDMLPMFGWQAGYGAFSISPSHAEALKQYINNQMEHHREESFQDEFRRLLQKYQIPYDEQYVWD